MSADSAPARPIMGVYVDGREVELAEVVVPLTAARSITVLRLRSEADAGWGLRPGETYDVWEEDGQEGRYRPWAKWRVDQAGVVHALRVPGSGTPNQLVPAAA